MNQERDIDIAALSKEPNKITIVNLFPQLSDTILYKRTYSHKLSDR